MMAVSCRFLPVRAAGLSVWAPLGPSAFEFSSPAGAMSESTPPPPIRIDHEGELMFVLVRPGLVSADWATTEGAADAVIRELGPLPQPRCIVDLSELDYLGSTQVAFVMRVWKAVKAAGGQFAVACPQRVVLEVLQLAGLEQVLTILPSRKAAAQRLAPPAVALPHRVQTVLLGQAVCGAVAAIAGFALHRLGRIPDSLGHTIMTIGAAVGVLAGGVLAVWAGTRSRWIGIVVVLMLAGLALTEAGWLPFPARRP
jgi:anti-anti-sigma factor